MVRSIFSRHELNPIGTAVQSIRTSPNNQIVSVVIAEFARPARQFAGLPDIPRLQAAARCNKSSTLASRSRATVSAALFP